MNQLPEGFRQLDDFEIGAVLKKYRDDKVLRLMVGDYQRLRNIEALNVRFVDEGSRRILALLPDTGHLMLNDKVIRACQEITDLRHIVEDQRHDLAIGDIVNGILRQANEDDRKRIRLLRAIAEWQWIIFSVLTVGVALLWRNR